MKPGLFMYIVVAEIVSASGRVGCGLGGQRKNAGYRRLQEIKRTMRQQIGFLMQLAVLALLPMLILWQLNYGFELIWMPAMTVLGIFVFWIGYKLRESK